ncbi:BtpA/SgcQ family protein [Dactylosporangium roseum]
MIHLPPLPGAGNYDGRAVDSMVERATSEARLLQQCGFSWLLLQNTHDYPSRATVPTATLAAMSAIGQAVGTVFSGTLGINVHKNDGAGALAVAHAVGAAFVRVKVLVGAWIGPEGLLEGNADQVRRLRRDLGSDIEVWADLGELTSVPLTAVPLQVQADWAARFGCADRLIVTEGDVRGSADAVRQARAGTSAPILIGGRTSPETVAEALSVSDGVIVGSCLRTGGRTTGDLDEAQALKYLAGARSAVPR